jgi:hypothetical protein
MAHCAAGLPNTTHLSGTLCSRAPKYNTPQWYTVQQDYQTLHTSVAHCAAGLPNTTHLSGTLCSRTNKHYTPQWHTVQQDYLTLHTSVAHCAAGLPNTTHLSGTHGGLKTGELVSMSPASFKWEARAGSFAFRACRALNDWVSGKRSRIAGNKMAPEQVG